MCPMASQSLWAKVRFGPNFRFVAKSAVFMFSACLIMFGYFSEMGGANFAETMGGDFGLGFLVVGLVVSIVVAYLADVLSDLRS